MINDSFSQFAKKIRQNKIDKDEIRIIKKEVIEINMKKSLVNKKVILIQKNIRGFLFRKKYNFFLEQKNTETVIEYLLENRKYRIHEHSEEIISFFFFKYIKKERKKKNIQKKKEYSINLIKAHLKGIISRKKFKTKLTKIRRSKKLILKYILSYKTRFILRISNIQNILNDIANIKLVLKNIDKLNEKNGQEIIDLKQKLNINLNKFYTTYYQYKENSSWVNEVKIGNNWIYEYLKILKKKNSEKRKYQTQCFFSNKREDLFNINKDKEENKCFYQKTNNYKNKNIYYRKDNKSMTQNNIKLIYNRNNTNNDNFKTKKNFNSEKNISIIKDIKQKNNYSNDSFEASVFKSHDLEEEKNNIPKTVSHHNYKKLFSPKANSNYKILQIYDNYMTEDSRKYKRTSSKINSNIKKLDNNFVYVKKKNNKNNEKKLNNIHKINREEGKYDFNNTNININLNRNKFMSKEEIPIQSIEINNLKNIGSPQCQRSRIIISPKRNVNIDYNELKNYNSKILDISTPKNKVVKISFSNTNISNTNNTDTIENIIDEEEFTIEVHKVKKNQNEKEPIKFGTHDMIEEIAIKRIKNKKLDYKEVFGEHKKGEDQPIGNKKIDYNLLFKNEECGIKEERIKVKKLNNNNINHEKCKKRLVYDAHKKVEEARLKEDKEENLGNVISFREFFKEMKNTEKEEKDKDKKDEENKIIRIKRNKNLQKKSDTIKKDLNNNFNKKNKNNILYTDIGANLNKTEIGLNRVVSENLNIKKYVRKIDSKEINTRKKIHELERSPTNLLISKNIKRNIECRNGEVDKKSIRLSSRLIEKDTKDIHRCYSYIKQKDISNFITNKKLKQISVNINKILKDGNNNNINRKPEHNINEKIKNYIENRLKPLYLGIEKIDDVFTIKSYFKQKENKMKKYNIPYIKEQYNFIKKYNNEKYDIILKNIEKQYKLLK